MRVLPLLLSIACLGACGYKGPLYLPQSKAEAGKPALVHPGPAPDRPLPAEAAPVPK